MRLTIKRGFTAARRGNWTGLSTFLLCGYFGTVVFEGAVRYWLSVAGIESALYIRDSVPIIFIGSALLLRTQRRLYPTVLIVFLCALLLHTLFGLFFFDSNFQRLFGLKVFLPFLLGMTIGYISTSDFTGLANRRIVMGVFLLTLGGVVLNNYYEFPWEGAEFESLFGVNVQSRAWTTDSVRRLAGFSRSSFDAASILLLCIVFLSVKLKSMTVRTAFLLAGIGGVFLTTTKGALFAVVVFVILSVFSGFGRRQAILKNALVVTMLVCVLLPVASLLIDFSANEFSSESFGWLSSFIERLTESWPTAFSLLNEHGNAAIGRGPGGIGVAQQYGEPELQSAADNIFVYWYVAFGLLGVIYFLFLIRRVVRWRPASAESSLMVFGLSIAIFLYGFTSNIIESPLLSAALGFCIVKFFSFRSNDGRLRSGLQSPPTSLGVPTH